MAALWKTRTVIPPIARRFVAGETTAEALDHVRTLNRAGVAGLLNLLGEHYDTREPADEDAAAYRTLIDDVDGSGLDACVSVKPTQLGLGIGESVFRENLGSVLERAAARDVFVWLDMEAHTTTDATLSAFESFVSDYPEMGVCVQANLKRTSEDIERLAALPGKVRLVKGAYDPPAAIAYTDRERVDRAFEENLRLMFERFDGGIAVGTHDPDLLDLATSLSGTHGTDVEIQMLMGVREDAQFELAHEYPVFQYVPFGRRWRSYFYRRLTERTQNLRFAMRALLGG